MLLVLPAIAAVALVAPARGDVTDGLARERFRYYSQMLWSDGVEAADRELVRRFDAANPDIDTTVFRIDGQQMKDNIRSFLTASIGPDALTWYSGVPTRRLVEDGLLQNITDLYERFGWNTALPASMKSACTFDGEQWCAVTDFYAWGIFYRRSIFTAHGIAEPQSFEDLLRACDILKAAGITPFTIGTMWRWTAAGWFDYLDMRINGPQFHADLMFGRASYDDPRVRAVFVQWRELIDSGYFVDDPRSMNWADAIGPYEDGSAAMYLMGDFLRNSLSPEVAADTGVFRFPIVDPALPVGEDAPADALMISANHHNLPAAKAFLGHMISGPSQIYRLNVTALPSHADAAALVDDPVALKGKGFIDSADLVLQFFDRDTPLPMANAGMDAMMEFWDDTSDANIDMLLERLEAVRQEVFLGKVGRPSFSRPSGVVGAEDEISITVGTEGAEIRYTVDGSVVTDESRLYTGPIRLVAEGTHELAAMALREGMINSEKVFATYIIESDEPPVVSKTSDDGQVALVSGLAAAGVVVAALLITAAVVRYRRQHPPWMINFDELKLTEMIGRGGFGEVWRANWRGVPVAVKLLRVQNGNTSNNGNTGGIDIRDTSATALSRASEYAESSTRQSMSLGTGASTKSPLSQPFSSEAPKSNLNMLTQYRTRQTALKAFTRELSILAQLRHPNILFFFGASLNPRCLVTEFMDQGSLFEILENKTLPLTWKRRMEMLLDVTNGLSFLHGQDPPLMHKDIKSPNILVDSRWVAKLGDLGLSGVRSSEAKNITPAWTAPEVIETRRHALASDVYSLAIVMWEMASRTEPYAGMPVSAILENVAYPVNPLRPEFPEDSPQGIVQLAQECWVAIPEARPTSLEISSRLQRLITTQKDVEEAPSEVAPYVRKIFSDSDLADAKRGTTIEPRTLPEVTFLFSDIVGYTALSSKLSGTEINNILHDLYTEFDRYAGEYGVDKIETIGDAYIGCCGLETESDHALRAARMALAMIRFTSNYRFKADGSDSNRIQIRIGLHSGPTTATILNGFKATFVGDTINMASRMESTSKPDRVQVSNETYRHLSKSSEISLVPRGAISIKGKDKVNTYFVATAGIAPSPISEKDEGTDASSHPFAPGKQSTEAKPKEDDLVSVSSLDDLLRPDPAEPKLQ